jgi:hypothetical protein
MITLKTLPDATAQEVFDQVVTHLRKQGRPAYHDRRCKYRTPDKLMCAGGCLMSDDEYSTAMEGYGFSYAYRYFKTGGSTLGGPVIEVPHQDLIKQLQYAHDHMQMWKAPGNVETELKKIAHAHDLIYTEPTKILSNPENTETQG